MGGDLSTDPPVLRDSILRLLWQDAEAGMLVIGPDQEIRQVNPTAERALGARGFGIGSTLDHVAREIIVDGDASERVRDEMPWLKALHGERVIRQNLTFTRPGEPVRRFVLSAEPIDLDGVTGALVSWHDVTDSWHYAEQTRTELDRLGALLEGASDYAIIMMDADGLIETWSTAAERLHGYGAEEAVGRTYASFFEPEDRADGLPQVILAAAAAQGKTQVEGRRVRKDGSVFWAHAALTAVRDEDGKLCGFVKVTHDVSDRRAMEQAAAQQNELLEQRVAERTVQLERQAADLAAVNAELEAFSYSVSHDLRAPLRAMNGFARLIEQEHGDELPDGARHFLGKVTENAQQMGTLIDALLTFSRMQRQNLNAVPIDMTALARETWDGLAPAWEDRKVELLLGELPAGLGDRRLIQQVWTNLLDNALKYTGRVEEARVVIAADVEGDGMVRYTVRDNGAGFDMRYAGKIGQVFQRLHHADEFAGTGIGLALVHRIVQRHGGCLVATGEPGVGASVGFTLRAAT